MLYAKFVRPDCGYEDEIKTSLELLKVGHKYKVEFVSIGRSYSNIHLAGFNHIFNSFQFDFEDENGLSVDIYEDPKYNPYLNFWR